jgi:hypothetical protein
LVVAEEGCATNCAETPGNPSLTQKWEQSGYVSLSQDYQLGN